MYVYLSSMVWYGMVDEKKKKERIYGLILLNGWLRDFDYY